MWQFPRQSNAGKCSPERRAVSSNARTVHVAAPSEACRVAEHVGVERKRWELVVLSVAIQSSLCSCCLQTQGNQRKVLVTEGCSVEISVTVSWHRLEVLRRCQFVNSSVQACLWLDATTCQRVSGTETAEVRCAVVLVFLSRHVLSTQPLYMATYRECLP